jgi:pSer/pThr/pTyr-binding forkhead associated (FHA) protein
VNGQRVKTERLRHLDVLTIGRNVDLIFVEAAAEGAKPATLAVVGASLEFLDGPSAGTSVEIPVGGIVLGRAAACNVVFDHRSVGKTHARLFRTDGQLTIEDLQSVNGTFVNGRRIQTEVLKNGDKIALGGVRTVRVSLSSDFRSGAEPESASNTEMLPAFDQEWRTKLVWSPQELAAIESARQVVVPQADALPREPQRPVAPQPPVAPVSAPAPPRPPALAPQVSAPPAKPPVVQPKPPDVAAKPEVAPKPQPRAAAPVSPPPAAKVQEAPSPPPPIDPLPNRVTTSAPVPEATVVSKPAEKAPPAPAASGIQGIEVVVGARTVKLATGEYIIGRALDAAIRLDTNDREVSRAHAMVAVRAEVVEVEDRSQNGTFVNNVRISSRTPLQDGDQVRCGSMTLTIRFVR